MTSEDITQSVPENGINVLVKPPITHLVNREDQIDTFERTLQNTNKDQKEKRFLEWSGSPGIGKTQLIRLLIEKVCLPHHYSYALIDFNTLEAFQWAYDPTLLMLHIAKMLQVDFSALQNGANLFKEVGSQIERIPEAYLGLSRKERLYSRPDWLMSLQAVRDEFLTALDSPGIGKKKKPFILFFDETEYADLDLVTWLEEWILSPLIQGNQNAVVVWMTRRQHRWARPEIQRHIFREQLEPFDKKGVVAQFKASNFEVGLVDAFFKKAFPITGGHPAANAVVIAQVQQDTSADFDSEEKSIEQDLLQTIYKQFILGRVLYGLPPEEKLACELLSIVRFFNASILRRVLIRVNEKIFAQWLPVDFKVLFERLKETQLLVWKNGFVIDPDFRHIIRDYYRVCKANTFIDINEELVTIHEEWLTLPVDNRSFFIIELLYHLASLRQAGKKVNLVSTLRKQLVKYNNIDDQEALRLALEKLSGEIENNTNEWLTGQQRSLLVKAIHQFEEENLA